MAGSGRGGREGRRERRRRERGGSRGRRRLGRRAGPRSLARATGRTGPGRQCAFVYVARAAAANIHLKSPRVSARQRPAAQSPSRRAPQTPGRRSLWYISDLTSRAGPILRWEPFRVHLGSQLGFFFFPFSERGVTSPLRSAQPTEPRHLTSPPPHPPHPRPIPAPPRRSCSSQVGEGATKARAEGDPDVGQVASTWNRTRRGVPGSTLTSPTHNCHPR